MGEIYPLFAMVPSQAPRHLGDPRAFEQLAQIFRNNREGDDERICAM